MSVSPSIPRRTSSSRIAATLCLLGLLALGVSALDLSASGLAHFLTSDFLTPYFFCRELLDGLYPMSGWTLSATPYFVPDHLLLSSLFAGIGPSGFAYSLFPFVFYPALFSLAGFCVKTVVGRTWPALLSCLLVGNTLLALRALPGHDLWLWRLGAPCCHGGVLLLGFAYLWTLGAGLRRGGEKVGRLLATILFCLGLLGLVSDSLFLFQILLPASAALFLGRRRRPEFAHWLRWQGGCAVAAFLVSQGFKLLCQFNGWFYFSRIIRNAPTPPNQWRALGKFVSDLPQLLHDGWGFFALLSIAVAVSLTRMFRARRNAAASAAGLTNEINAGALEFFRLFCVASLILTLPLPILAANWKEANDVRYLFNWLVLPGFLLALEIAAAATATRPPPAGARFRRWGLAIAAAVFLLCLGVSGSRLRYEPLQFPYPDDVAALDALLQHRGLKYGLAQYWDSKYVTALSHAGAELRQIRANCDLYFWDNNAFGYYERTSDPAGNPGRFAWPDYQYILTDLLDEQAVARVFGEPQTKESAGRLRVWIYGTQGESRIRHVLEPAVRTKLGPRRLRQLGQVAPAMPRN